MFKIGQSIGDYAILQELGKGGFGQVYKVEHTLTGRREAMKVLAAGQANEAEQTERFLREIRVQASLSHPNIAAVHTAFWVNDDLALVCELLEGQSLQRLMEGQQLPVEQALAIIAQVLDALSYAHTRGIVHRDVSPGNIFVTTSGTVKLIDFGLAKAATDLRLTREGSPVGAAHYMSPEQIRGARELDARTDIYSSGVVLYALVTGREPFEGDNAFDIMKAHMEQAPALPAEAGCQIPAALSAIILRALEKKPEDRFQSADAFLQAVRPLQKQPEPASAAKRSFRHPILVAAIAMLTILIGMLVARIGTSRLSSAPLSTNESINKSFSAPPAPAITTAVPSLPAPATPPSQRTVVPKRPRQKTTTVANSPAVEQAVPEQAAPADTQSNPTPASAPQETKPGNPVVKIAKKLNPFKRAN
jgi:eukaryotic-like serine/threonine-protein kinase